MKMRCLVSAVMMLALCAGGCANIPKDPLAAVLPAKRLALAEDALAGLDIAVDAAYQNKLITQADVKKILPYADAARAALFAAEGFQQASQTAQRDAEETKFRTAFEQYKSALPAGVIPTASDSTKERAP